MSKDLQQFLAKKMLFYSDNNNILRWYTTNNQTNDINRAKLPKITTFPTYTNLK